MSGRPEPAPLVDIPDLTRSSAYLRYSDSTVAELMREIARQIPARVTIDPFGYRSNVASLSKTSSRTRWNVERRR